MLNGAVEMGTPTKAKAQGGGSGPPPLAKAAGGS
jgi:hypothetical protein